MNKLKTILLISGIIAAQASMALNRIPNDPDVRIGNLPNGLTYYVRANSEPAGMADFFIAQRVGSVQEEENQRGLAHFLEHMCFNGTEHFPGNSMIDYLESVGVKFGANLNAYTASDETVYNISQVPVGKESTQDSCLLILRDWSHGLSLDGNEIDAERGVIHGEWRQRQDAPSARLLEKTAPIIYEGSIYGGRLPISKMDVVLNFEHDALRDFYHKWYNPENQCVIVVGDIDPDRIEQKIAEMFGDIPMGNNRVEPSAIPENKDIISTIQTDSEQPYTSVTLYIKHDDVDDEEVGTIAEIRRDLVAQLVSAMLVERFDLLELDPDVPFTNAGIGDLNFLLSHSQKALLVRANAKNGNANDCVEAFAGELKRAAAHGFTQSELDRAKISYKSDLDSEFANYSKTTNTQFARKYVRHFLDGGALPSMEAYYKMMKGVISNVSLDDVNAFLRQVVRDDNRNVVIYVYAQPAQASDVTDQSLAQSYAKVDGSQLTPYIDEYVESTIMENLPTPGEIVTIDSLPAFGAKMLTLSNGIRVYMKRTDFSPDRISIAAHSPGGFSQNYDSRNVSDYLLCNDALAVSGINGMSSVNVGKLLAGKNVKCSICVENMEEQLSASSSVADIETAMQLLYLKATSLSADTAAFDAMMANQRLKFENRNTNATYAMGDSIHLNVYKRHPLGAKLSEQDLDNAKYGNIMDIYRDRFGDMGDFSFFIVGNYNEDEMMALIKRYIASLPAQGRFEKPKDIGYGYSDVTERRIFVRDMEMPQSIVYTFYNGECEYCLDNVQKANVFGQILSARMRKDIREDRGWTYGVKTHCSISAGMNGEDPAHLIMPVYIKVAPGVDEACADIVLSTVADASVPGNISQEEVLPALKYMEKNYNEGLSENGYWMLVLRVYDKFGLDMHSGYLDNLHSIEPIDITNFAKDYVQPASVLQLIMRAK